MYGRRPKHFSSCNEDQLSIRCHFEMYKAAASKYRLSAFITLKKKSKYESESKLIIII